MDETTETSPTENGTGTTDKLAIVKVVLALAIVALFVIFALQNTASIDVDFLAWSFATPQIILMLLSGVAGILIWELAGFLRRRRARS